MEVINACILLFLRDGLRVHEILSSFLITIFKIITSSRRIKKMGETASVFTLKTQFIYLDNIFSVDEVHVEALLDSFVLFDLERGEIFSGREEEFKRKRAIAHFANRK